MKFFRKKNFSLLLLTFSTLFSSCSMMGNREVLIGDSKPKASSSKSTSADSDVVTKEQYDQLLNKYESLLDKIKKAEQTSVSAADSQVKPLQSSVPASTDQDKMMKELSKINPQADLAETVDVFAKNMNSNSGLDNSDVLETAPKMSDSEIQKQLDALSKANTLVKQNKIDSALILLKDLEASKNKQIRVRAKFYLAEMLFRQSEFDLALQMYEEIITKYAFSGLVVKSLGRLIVCSEKLKLAKKKERYYSVLHDFFGA